MGKNNDYYVGIMFSCDFRHHNTKNGKPTTKLLNLDGTEAKNIDATLFFPTKEGIVITEFLNGEMTAYSYLILNENDIAEVKKTPYGILRNIPNKLEIPSNVFHKYIPKLITRGHETWFMWKAMMNSKDLDIVGDGTIATLTAKQDRIPNVGMRIYDQQQIK